MNRTRLPPGWKEEIGREDPTHYEEQIEEEATAEDEATPEIVESN